MSAVLCLSASWTLGTRPGLFEFFLANPVLGHGFLGDHCFPALPRSCLSVELESGNCDKGVSSKFPRAKDILLERITEIQSF
jgi:hypothetical protein